MKAIHCVAVFAALALAAVPSSATELTIDGSTVESYERSIRQMADALSEEEKELFAAGLINMILTEYPAAKGKTGLSLLMLAEPATKAAHITLDGKTLAQIIERGRSLEEKERSAKGSEIAKLSDESEREATRRCLQSKVRLSNAAIEAGIYSGHDVRIDVTNGLTWPIAGIRVAYQVFSEGRSVPWIKQDFAVSISGGIEPGETRTVQTTAFVPTNAPKILVTHAQVLDVSDQFERLLIGDTRIIGWSEQPSENRCAQSAQ